MRFYGTSAAEAIPNPFCSCYLCENARKMGGKDVRHRSMFRIDEETCIDMGGDALIEAERFGDFKNLRQVLVTHTHEDHLNYAMLGVRKMATERAPEPLTFYMTDRAFEMAEFYRREPYILKGETRMMEDKNIIRFEKLEFGKEVTIGDKKVLPLRGNHLGNVDENSANYFITLKNGHTMYYGLDTGYYLEETFEALKGRHIDILISECTYGNDATRPEKPFGHLDQYSCMRVFHRLFDQGTIDANTRIYLTHINHTHTATHAELSRFFAEADLPCKIEVGYDGMEIED